MSIWDDFNPNILRECREQMAYNLEAACIKSGIKTIGKMEAGEKKPTFKQLAKLSELYCVPDWVFISDQIPEEYKFSLFPSFRHIQVGKNIGAPPTPKIRQLMVRVEEYRRVILEYRKYMSDPMPQYKNIPYNDDYKAMAIAVRQWLGITKPLPFNDIRKRVEQKNIFVFMTSKFIHWSKSNVEDFRGFAIYKEVLPMIVINDSDAKRAQSFTLYYELAHIIRKKSVIDISSYSDEDDWCNGFASNALMPEDELRHKISISGISVLYDLEQIKKMAKEFCVSADACVIQLMQLGEIGMDECNSYLDILRKERSVRKKDIMDKGVPISRQIHKEALHRFGGVYAKTVWQAYHNDQIGLHKLCQLFEIKRANVALSMKELL